MRLILLILLYFFISVAQAANFQFINEATVLAQKKVPIYNYQVVKIYPHDPTSFTEGLVFNNHFLYESTGLYGQSKLRRMDLKTGNILQEYVLSPQYFAEGITILGDKLYQLTYHAKIGFVYDKNNFKLLNNFQYDGEGWGLTTDGKQLIMSNGTSGISFYDPKTFQMMRQITVHSMGENIGNINELEYIDGKIYANIWFTDLIAIISPQTGEVIGWINLAKLHTKINPNNVLNGIAYNPQDHTLLVTGKNWPSLFAIKVAR